MKGINTKMNYWNTTLSIIKLILSLLNKEEFTLTTKQKKRECTKSQCHKMKVISLNVRIWNMNN